jgi:hypothetical protein
MIEPILDEYDPPAKIGRNWHRLNSYKINSLIEAISGNLGISLWNNV